VCIIRQNHAGAIKKKHGEKKDMVSDWLRRPHVRDGLAVGLLLFLIALFLGPALLPGRVLLPLDIVTQGWPPWQQPNRPVEVQNWLLTDVVNYIFPVKKFMAENIRAGTIPLWNPHVLTGVPFTYNTQAGLFYPLSLFYYLFSWPVAVDAMIAGQMVLGGLFMFAYLRLLTKDKPPTNNNPKLHGSGMATMRKPLPSISWRTPSMKNEA